jgi:hypothetical protein
MKILQPYIRPCPQPNYGVHIWTLEAAWDCRRAGVTPDEAIELITERMTRPPQGREVVDSVAKAFDADLVAQCTYQPRIKSVYDPDKLTSNLCRHYFNRMTGRSKIGLDTSPRHETRRSPIPTMAYAIQILHLSELFYRRY